MARRAQTRGYDADWKKYQLDGIFEEAVKRLKAQFPENLTIHDSMAVTSGAFFQWIDTYFPQISRLAEEMALWSILPLTYYTAASCDDTIVSRTLILVGASSSEFTFFARYSRHSFFIIILSRLTP